MIIPLTPSYLRSVSEANVVLDPTSFLADQGATGIEFRQKFYYPALMEDPDCFVWLYLFEGAVAGYIAGTKDCGAFLKRLKRFNPLGLGGLVMKALLKRPGLSVKYAQMLAFKDRDSASEPHPAEILSFGVYPQFRGRDFKTSTGISVAQALFNKAMESFRLKNVRKFQVLTLQENIAGNRFYEKQGCRKAGVASPFGSPCNVYVGEVVTR